MRALIARAVGAGMTALGDIKESITYKSYSASSSYDADSGTVTRTETSTTLSGVFMDYTNREIDGEVIRPRDQKFLFRQALLAVAPTLNDRIVRSGKTWEVFGVEQDPAAATWTLQVRSING